MSTDRIYMTDNELISATEFRGMFSRSTLQKYRVTGAGPKYIKVGIKCFYTVEWTREWLSAKVVNSTSDRAA